MNAHKKNAFLIPIVGYPTAALALFTLAALVPQLWAFARFFGLLLSGTASLFIIGVWLDRCFPPQTPFENYNRCGLVALLASVVSMALVFTHSPYIGLALWFYLFFSIMGVPVGTSLVLHWPHYVKVIYSRPERPENQT